MTSLNDPKITVRQWLDGGDPSANAKWLETFKQVRSSLKRQFPLAGTSVVLMAGMEVSVTKPVEIGHLDHDYERLFACWFHRAKQLAIDQKRHQDVEKRYASFYGEVVFPSIESRSAESILADKEQIDFALRKLDITDIEIITLRHLDGLEYDQIAKMLGITEATARMRSSRSLSRLRKVIAESEQSIKHDHGTSS